MRRGGQGRLHSYTEPTARENVTGLLLFILLDATIGFLFYRSLIAALLLAPAYLLFRKEYRRSLLLGKQQRMRQEFMTGMQLIGTSLQAGYAVENTFEEVLPELRRIYGGDAFITDAFEQIAAKLSVRESVESALTQLGEATQIEEIRSFAQIFRAARRTGGDMIAIVRNTVTGISEKEATRLEIETMLSGRQMEQKIMGFVPLMILGYTGLTSPELMRCMYHNPAGIAIMTVCLAVYALAYAWGRKIMDIEV